LHAAPTGQGRLELALPQQRWRGPIQLHAVGRDSGGGFQIAQLDLVLSRSGLASAKARSAATCPGFTSRKSGPTPRTSSHRFDCQACSSEPARAPSTIAAGISSVNDLAPPGSSKPPTRSFAHARRGRRSRFDPGRRQIQVRVKPLVRSLHAAADGSDGALAGSLLQPGNRNDGTTFAALVRLSARESRARRRVRALADASGRFGQHEIELRYWKPPPESRRRHELNRHRRQALLRQGKFERPWPVGPRARLRAGDAEAAPMLPNWRSSRAGSGKGWNRPTAASSERFAAVATRLSGLNRWSTRTTV